MPAESRRKSRNRAVFWGLLACALLTAHALAYFNQTFDDVFISLRYAQNLAAGHGVTFNPGLRQEGYSNLLLILVVGLLNGFGVDPLLAAKLLSLAAALGVVVLLVAMHGRAPEVGDDVPPLAALALACSPSLAFWAGQGLETCLFAFLIAASVASFGTSWRTGRGWWLCYACVALATITRPEGALVGCLLAAGSVLLPRDGRRWSFATAVRLLAVALGTAAIQVAWRLPYYGSIFPNPYYHKVSFGAATAWRGAQYLFATLKRSGGPVVLPLALAGALRANDTPEVLLSAVVGAGYLLLFVLPVGGDFMRGDRFLVPALPLLWYAGEGGLRAVLRSPLPYLADHRRGARAALVILFLAAIGAGFIGQRAEFPAVPSWYESPHIVPRNALYTTAVWLEDHADRRDSVLLSEMGIIPYYTRMPCYDYLGLVDRELYDAGRRFHPERIAQHPVDYVILTERIDTDGHTRGRTWWDGKIQSQPWFHRLYAEVARFPIDRHDDELSDIYYALFPAWRIDFVVYRLRAGGAGPPSGWHAFPEARSLPRPSAR